LEKVFVDLDSPIRLNDIELGEKESQMLIDQYNKNGVSGVNHNLNSSDYQQIVELMK